ncbi:MAG: 1-deoxy-D-xylulose-5-phosphate synthase [Verrucomicrobiota bacterium]|nr:1-deoxy-D-xylulose-5-phosphate synthase [Verrucomicrobiota bacterium]
MRNNSLKNKKHFWLNKINKPKDILKLENTQLTELAEEIRSELIDTVSQNGGHLAPNLGVVELTIALFKIFSPSKDKIIWDTSHQAYVYKLLTGRQDLFKKLRQDDGCCGFLTPEESEYDHFGTGHAGTCLSAALGMAVARDHLGGDEKVIAVVGDGALACGISFEALNHIAEITNDFILILNDNKMSIGTSVGAISNYLNKIISGQHYNAFKKSLSSAIEKIPRIGKKIRQLISKAEEAMKSLFVPGVFFEELGFRYIGPIDGHDIRKLCETLEKIKDWKRPIVLHVITEKGHGYPPAVSNPEIFHGIGSFDISTGKSLSEKKDITFSDGLGNILLQKIEKNKKIIAITAGMTSGTGLSEIQKKYPDNFYDVGIAEEHSVIFAGGMATNKLRPIVVIYATFIQRALDCIYHDVCLQDLPVLFCLDRAGIVPDGPTHHGIYDLSFLLGIPNLFIYQPADAYELQIMIEHALTLQKPIAIRYPKSSATTLDYKKSKFIPGKAISVRDSGTHLSLWALGREVETAIEIHDILLKKNIHIKVVNPMTIRPFDIEFLYKDAEKMPIVTLEDHCITCGMGNRINMHLNEISSNTPLLNLGWPDSIIPFGTITGIRRKFGMLPEQLADRIEKFVKSQ